LVSGHTEPLEAGTHVITASGSEACEIEVPDWTDCRLLEPPLDDVLVPRAVLLGTVGSPARIPITVRTQQGRGCGCTGASRAGRDDRLALSPQLCGCCADCECVDPGYEVNEILYGPSAPGDYVIDLPSGPMPLAVRDYCEWTPAARVELVPFPDAELRHSGPDLTWVTVTSERSYCLSTPLVVDQLAPLNPGAKVVEIRLDLRVCDHEWECGPEEPTGPVTVLTSLGELPPGRYRLVAGEDSLELTR
jgi:hypothetical protein